MTKHREVFSPSLPNGSFPCRHSRECEYYMASDEKGNCTWCGGARTEKAIRRMPRLRKLAEIDAATKAKESG